MPDLLQAGADWLDSVMTESVSRPVVFCRGSATVDLDATIGATTFEGESKGGQIFQWESRDFIVSSADLELNGDLVEPVIGDLFNDTINGIDCVFQVLAPDGGKPFKYCDPGRTSLRIHTKQVFKDN